MEPRRDWYSFVSDTRVMVVLLAGGVAAFVAVFVVLFTNASFTQSSRSEGNRLAAGTVGLSLSKPGRIVDATDLVPGQSRSGDIEVANTGDRAKLSVIATGVPAASALGQALRLKITPAGQPGNVIHNAPLAPASRIDLGTQNPGQTSAWTFELTLPTSAAGLRNASLDAAFEWEARTP